MQGNPRHEQDQRALLFGARGGKGRQQRAYEDPNDSYNNQMEAERQNDDMIDDLEAKVGQLKQITHGIGGEIGASNGLIEQMSTQFDSAGSMLTGTVGKLNQMLKQKTGGHMWHMVLFIVFIFMLLWLVI